MMSVCGAGTWDALDDTIDLSESAAAISTANAKFFRIHFPAPARLRFCVCVYVWLVSALTAFWIGAEGGVSAAH